MTLEELFGEYLERYAKVYKKSWSEDVGLFRRYLKEWSQRKISEIRRMDVVELHARIGRKHPYAANRIVALLRSLFNKARVEWEWKGSNPAQGLKKFREVSRKRFLQPDELPAFFKAVDQEPNQEIADYVLVSLLTGARQSNILGMRWEDVQLERRIWSIPQTKSGEGLDVVLSPEALEILWRRKRQAAGPWVFPGPGKTGHLVGVRKAWARILQRAGITNLRLHDLRRTLGSWQAAGGSSLLIIGRSLGHTRTETTAVYARLSLDPVRESVERATRALMDAGRLLPESTERSAEDGEIIKE